MKVKMISLLSQKLKSSVSVTFIKNTGLIFIICFSFLMCGATRTYISFLMPELKKNNATIPIDQEEASWLSALSSLSNPLGFLLGGFMMDFVGRKWSTSCTFLPFIAGWALITCANNLVALYIGTCLHGVAAGMTMTAAAYISEISVSEYRGFFLSLLSVSYWFGVVMCSVIYTYNILEWRYLALYFFIISVLMFLSTHKLPESPYWLIIQGRIDDAREVLEDTRDNQDTIKEEISKIEESINGKNPLQKTNPWISLLRAWKQIGILIILASLHKISGFTPISQYTPEFFGQFKGPVYTKRAALIYSIVSFLSTVLVPYFTHNFNRRSLLFVTSLMAGLFMLFSWVYEFYLSSLLNENTICRWIPLLGIYGYTISTTIGITSIAVILPGEILPTEISGISNAFHNISSSIITSLVNKTYFAMSNMIGFQSVLGIFAGCCFLIALLSVTILPETRGKTLREIQDTYFPRRDLQKESNTESNVEKV
ncbi:facilitated trehalose transporter Tret1-like isoform X2 [Planococcus citri]